MTKKVFLLFLFCIFLSTQTASADETENSASLTKLGINYIEKGDRKNALQVLKKAVKIAPDYPFAHLYLGRVYFLMQDPENAVREFSIFKEKMGPVSKMSEEMKTLYREGLHSICEIYFVLKMYEDCKEKIDEILSFDPNDQTALYNLGVYYYVYEHSRPKAYQSFKKAIDINPASSTSKRAEYAIEFMRTNPDSRVAPDFSFIDKE